MAAVRTTIVALGLLACGLAHAADDAAPAPPPEDELPIPTLTIERVPPSASYEFAMQVSYGEVTYWRQEVPPWIGFGFRGGWGKNFGPHRFGPDLTITAEGPVGVHSTFAIEPHFNWDFISNKGILVGAGIGPAALLHTRSDTVSGDTAFGVAPSVVARLGYSQGWSRVGRRIFIFVEPKLRWVDDRPNPLVAIAVGSGQGY